MRRVGVPVVASRSRSSMGILSLDNMPGRSYSRSSMGILSLDNMPGGFQKKINNSQVLLIIVLMPMIISSILIS